MGCHGIKGAKGNGYDIPGTKCFSEVLLCGAGDGFDEQAKAFGSMLISLGRRESSKAKAVFHEHLQSAALASVSPSYMVGTTVR
jgi:hypothetical protein